MTGQSNVRADLQSANAPSMRKARRLPVGAACSLLLLTAGAITLAALSTPASAGFDDSCNFGYIEVDDDYPSSTGPPTCQYKTLVEVSLLALQPTDVIRIHNGNYVGLWNMTVNGLTLIGDSMSGVFINGTALSGAPFSIRAWDTNLTNMTLRGSSNGLEIDAVTQTQTNRTTLTNIAIQGSPSWACLCYGANTRVRGMSVYNMSNGVLGYARGLDIDGLLVNTTGSGSYRLAVFGSDNVRVANATLWGSNASLGLYLETNTNVSIERVFIENASYGIYSYYGGVEQSIRNATVRSAVYGVIIQDGYGFLNLTGLDIQSSTRYSVYYSYGSHVANLSRSTIVGTAGTAIEWQGGMGLDLSDTVIRDSGADAIRYNVYGYTFRVRNLTVDNAAASGIYATYGVNASDSSINRTHDAVYLGDYTTGTVLSNLTLTNTSNRAVHLGFDNQDAVLSNLTIVNASEGIYGRYLRRATFADNRITDVMTAGFNVEVQYSRFFGNSVANAPHGYNLNILSSTASEYTYNDIPTTNTLDGKPIIYVLNQTGVAVNSSANTIWIFNSTGITIDGVNQTAGPSGIFLYSVANVSIRDSRIIGNVSVGLWITKGANVSVNNLTALGWQWVDGIQLSSTSNATLTNITEAHPTTSASGISMYGVADISIGSAVFLNGSNCVYISVFQRVTISEAGGTCTSYGIYAESGAFLNVSRFFVPQDISTGFYAYSVNSINLSDSVFARNYGFALMVLLGRGANLTNVSVASDSWALYMDSFNNATIRNSTMVSRYDWTAYISTSPDFRSFNSTYVSLADWAFVMTSNSYNALFVHNNFYGYGLYDGSGYGTWHGGFPVGGNYYDWAVGGFVDERIGPGQNSLVGHDGIKDAPAYAIGGGKNDNYALMDAWPPKVGLTRPRDGSLMREGTLLNFSISNFFDNVTWTDSATGNSTRFSYPHDINTSRWADGWHNITIVAKNDAITSAQYAVPVVTVTFSFEFDSTGPVFVATPLLGFPAVARGSPIDIVVIEPHLNASWYVLDGSQTNLTPPWSIDTSALLPGSHSLVLFANDSLNNSATYLWSFYIDANAPNLGRLSPLANDYFVPGTMIVYGASDDFNLTSVVFTAVEAGASWSYSGNLTPTGSDWMVDTTAFAEGCYALDVYASDEAGHITAEAWSFCVDSTPPDLSAFTDSTADEDTDYTFAGNLVFDLDPTPAFEWRFDDTVLLALTTLTGRNPVHMFDTPGGYNINLTVTDRAGNSAAVDFALWVNDMEIPNPDFSVDATWPEDVDLALDASSSWDNDGYWDGGATGTFEWEIIGDAGGWSLTGMVTSITFTEPGWYNITLNLWDASFNFATLTREIRILDTTAPTIAIDGDEGPLNEGATLNLSASRSTDNDPTSSLVFSWRFTYGSARVVAGPELVFEFVTPGQYTISLHVFDAAGNEALWTLFLRINDVPAISGTPLATIAAGAGYEWTAEVDDVDPADVHTFTLLSGPNGLAISSSGVVAWQTAAASYGVYNVAFRVSDGIGSVDFTYVLTVTRSANAANRAPFFSSFPVQTALPGSAYSYTVAFGDPDVDDRVTLALASGPQGMALDSANVLRWQVPADASGTTYAISLLISDGLESVWQNFTFRARPNNLAPAFGVGKVPPTVSVEAGKDFTLVIDGTFASDNDDAFGLLSFFASASDGTVLGVTLTQSGAEWTLTITGLKPGTSTVTLRVADPSGLNAEAPIQTTVTAVVSPAPAGSALLLLLLLAALAGAGVVGIVVMRRRKKGDEGAAPLAGAPPSPAAAAQKGAAEVVEVEVVQVPIAAPAAAPAAPKVTVPAVAVAVPLAAAAAVAARVPEVEPLPAVSKPSKAATYVVEGLFVIYQDGRMIYSKTDIGQQQLGDPELVSSMFTAVQQFIKDSFSAEGELNKMGYGDNQIVIERGNQVFMAVITFGEPDKDLQETMSTAIEKMAYAYAGIIEAWDGQQNRFADVEKYVAPVLALTAGVTRQDVLSATTTKDIKVLSQLEFFQGFVRLKVGVKNDTEAVITKVTLDIDYNEDVLRLQRIEPASYKTSGARVMLNVLNPGEKSSVAFYFDPQICTETNIDGIVRFRDYKGVLSSVTMKTRKAEVVCPLFFTKEHANTAMLKRLIENELQEKDSKVYTITKLPPYVKHKDIFDVAKSVVLSHDVHMVREFVSYNPFSGEAWFYGETKVKNYKIVIRAAVREDNTIEFFAASTVIKAVTGLLAEFNHTLMSMIVERYSDVKIEQVYDEAKKHEIQAKSLVERLGEGEAGAGETEQR